MLYTYIIIQLNEVFFFKADVIQGTFINHKKKRRKGAIKSMVKVILKTMKDNCILFFIIIAENVSVII